MPRVVLASASPRRREFLAALLSDFDAIPSEIDEPMTGDAESDAMRLACDKARAVAAARPEAIVIGADTIVHDGLRPYAKPASPAEAISILRSLRGREHRVVTGLAVVVPAEDDRDAAGAAASPWPADAARRRGRAGGGTRSGFSAARVTLENLSDGAIAAYVASGRPLDKAGAYAIQDEDVPTVAVLNGCYCCVVGLPLWRLRDELLAAGVAAREPHLTFACCADCPERPAP